MGTLTNGIYLPSIDEKAWGASVNANFSRLSELGVNVKAYGAVGDGVGYRVRRLLLGDGLVRP